MDHHKLGQRVLQARVSRGSHSSYFFLVYDFSAALLLFKIGTFCVLTEVELGFGILSQNQDCPT